MNLSGEGDAENAGAEDPEAEEETAGRKSIAFRVPGSRLMFFTWLGLVALLPTLAVFPSAWALLLPIVGG